MLFAGCLMLGVFLSNSSLAVEILVSLLEDGRWRKRICCCPIYPAESATEVAQGNAHFNRNHLLVLGLKAATRTTCTKRTYIALAGKWCTSLKLRGRDADRWDFISDDRENDLGKKYTPKNAATNKRALAKPTSGNGSRAGTSVCACAESARNRDSISVWEWCTAAQLWSKEACLSLHRSLFSSRN